MQIQPPGAPHPADRALHTPGHTTKCILCNHKLRERVAVLENRRTVKTELETETTCLIVPNSVDPPAYPIPPVHINKSPFAPSTRILPLSTLLSRQNAHNNNPRPPPNPPIQHPPPAGPAPQTQSQPHDWISSWCRDAAVCSASARE